MNQKQLAKIIVPWILVNTIGIVILAVAEELLGVKLADDLFTALGPSVYHFEGSYWLAVIIIWILLGWFISLGQGFVLKPYLPQFNMASWRRTTRLGWFVSSIIGFPAVIGFAYGSSAIPFSIIVGTILGLFQWVALKRQEAGKGRWQVAHALAWGIGWSLIISILTEGTRSIGPIILGTLLLSLITGLTLPGLLFSSSQNIAYSQ